MRLRLIGAGNLNDALARSLTRDMIQYFQLNAHHSLCFPLGYLARDCCQSLASECLASIASCVRVCVYVYLISHMMRIGRREPHLKNLCLCVAAKGQKERDSERERGRQFEAGP